MTVQRSERFDTDLEHQFRWYLLETDLDPVDALALATRFAEAVDAALEFLGRNPESGRRRFRTYPDLAGTRTVEPRSWSDLLPAHLLEPARSSARANDQLALTRAGQSR